MAVPWQVSHVQGVDLTERFVDLRMPQRPFQTLDLLPYLLPSRCLTLHQPCAVLLQHGQFHRVE
jgi:hypothetical protein